HRGSCRGWDLAVALVLLGTVSHAQPVREPIVPQRAGERQDRDEIHSQTVRDLSRAVGDVGLAGAVDFVLVRLPMWASAIEAPIGDLASRSLRHRSRRWVGID